MVQEVCARLPQQPDRSLTEDERSAFCRGRITHYKIPRYVRCVTGCRKTVTGKVQRFIMRERLAKQLAGVGRAQ